jgi:hypothetical protein
MKRWGADKAVEGKAPKAVARAVAILVEERELDSDRAKGLDFHVKWGLRSTNSFIKMALRRTDLAHGIRWLTRLRTLAFWTGPRAAKANLVASWWASVCPSCGRVCKEDMPHILLECPLHNELRHRLIQPVVEWVAGANPALVRAELAAALLGGQVGGMTFDQVWLGAITHPTLEGNAPFLRVAEFLQEAMPQRMARLWSDQTPQLARVECGTVLPEDFPLPTHHVEVVIPLVLGQRSRSPQGYGCSARAMAG